ncbi:hypothetical protein PTKIN_Ptkin09bG0017000 [Pterospermum kingtungense]
MASHHVLNQNDRRLANAAADGFRMLDEIYGLPSPPPADRWAGIGWLPRQYPYKVPYYYLHPPGMGYGNQVNYPREQVISSIEAAQLYGGVILKDLLKAKTSQQPMMGKGFPYLK